MKRNLHLRSNYLMLTMLFILSVAPMVIQAQKAPWGFTQMNFGPQLSWSKQSEDWTSNGYQLYNRHNNLGMGLNGRIQWSFLDMLLFGEDNSLSDVKFRIVDVVGFEGGMGYLTDKASAYDQVSQFETTDKSLWYNFGIDAGLAAMYRFLPQLDLGIKYTYVAHANATFGENGHIRYDNGSLIEGNSGRTLKPYGNSSSWGGIGRYGKFYGEFLIMKAKPNYLNVNIFDLKYCLAKSDSHKTWAPYVGIQIGLGKTLSGDNYNGSSGYQMGASSSYTSNWIQFTIGKMTNY